MAVKTYTIKTTVDKYGIWYGVIDPDGLEVAGANSFTAAVNYALLYAQDDDDLEDE